MMPLRALSISAIRKNEIDTTKGSTKLTRAPIQRGGGHSPAAHCYKSRSLPKDPTPKPGCGSTRLPAYIPANSIHRSYPKRPKPSQVTAAQRPHLEQQPINLSAVEPYRYRFGRVAADRESHRIRSAVGDISPGVHVFSAHQYRQQFCPKIFRPNGVSLLLLVVLALIISANSHGKGESNEEAKERQRSGRMTPRSSCAFSARVERFLRSKAPIRTDSQSMETENTKRSPGKLLRFIQLLSSSYACSF